MQVIPNDDVLGAEVRAIDLGQALDASSREAILQALATYGVLCFPQQSLSAVEQMLFCENFGSLEVNVAAGRFHVDGHPQVMMLSNIVEHGRAIGLGDAGQGWHTDMSYSATIALSTVLHAIEVPHKDGRPLGATLFANMYEAYEGLPESVKLQIKDLQAVHDFEKFWEMMRQKPDSQRPAMSAAQRLQKPPVTHPLVMRHPVSKRLALYANPGYAVSIEGLQHTQSDELLESLFKAQLQPQYQYEHHWRVGDLLMWDDIATMHNAVPDYSQQQPRRMHRCQILADRVFATAAVA